MAYDRNPVPHRHMKRGMRGADVKRLQAAINLRLKRKKARTRIAVDGEWGAKSQLAYHRAGYLIGLPHYKPTIRCQAITRNPALRTPAMVRRSRANAKEWRSRQHGTQGARAVAWLGRYVGKTETGHNDAPWLRAWENSLPHNGLDWMIPGQPYCGFGCVVSYWNGAKVQLPDDTVSTVAIANRAAGGRGYKRVTAGDARTGDLAVMHFGAGGPKHVAEVRSPVRNGTVKTREANTSPGNSGSQSNGGGVWDRVRPVGFVHTFARPI